MHGARAFLDLRGLMTALTGPFDWSWGFLRAYSSTRRLRPVSPCSAPLPILPNEPRSAKYGMSLIRPKVLLFSSLDQSTHSQRRCSVINTVFSTDYIDRGLRRTECSTPPIVAAVHRPFVLIKPILVSSS